jgi:uncharacterized membrane protein YbjE (DUF340 family)
MTIVLVLGIFVIGIALGYILRNKHFIAKYIDKVSNVSVYVLLFFLGISVGKNKVIVLQLGTIGLKAILLTIFALVFSIACSYLLYKFAFKKNETSSY